METRSCQLHALRKGFADLGYIDGKPGLHRRQNHVLEYRFAKGDSEALPKLARELVDGQPPS